MSKSKKLAKSPKPMARAAISRQPRKAQRAGKEQSQATAARFLASAPAQLGLSQRAQAAKQLQRTVGGVRTANRPTQAQREERPQRSLSVISPDRATENEPEEVSRPVEAGQPTSPTSTMLPTGGTQPPLAREVDTATATAERMEPAVPRAEEAESVQVEEVAAQEERGQAPAQRQPAAGLVAATAAEATPEPAAALPAARHATEAEAETEGAVTEAEPPAKAPPAGAAGAGKEAAAAAAGATVETGKPEEAAAEGGAPAPAAAAPGGAAGGAAGGEPQGGSEEEGAAELEERLAKADPERAAADEADPAAVAKGEPIGPEDEETPAAPEISEPPEPASEMPAGSTAPAPTGGLTGTPPAPSPADEGAEAAAPDSAALSAAGGMGGEAEGIGGGGAAPEPAETAEEPASADGFAGDEPALGGGALHHSEMVPALSEAEKGAALASLSEGGGGGGAPGGGGGGGGGGGASETQAPAPPDVSNAEPEAALAQASSLPPAQLQASLGGVSAAIGKSVDSKKQELAASPPKMKRPTGSPKVLKGGEAAEAPRKGEVEKVEKTPEGQAKPTPEPEPVPAPPPSPAENVPEPQVAGTPEGELSGDDVDRMQSSLRNLPTGHPGLETSAGPAPKVVLEGEADPAKNAEQKQKLQESVSASLTKGRQDAAQDLGEKDALYPEVPEDETLTADATAAAGGAGGAAAGGPEGAGAAEGGGAADAEAASIIAQEEKGSDIQAAVAKGRADLAAKRQEHGEKVEQEKTKSRQDIDTEVERSSTEQAAAREKAQGEVGAKRGEWTQEQEKAVTEANKKSDKTYEDGQKEISDKRTAAEASAEQHLKKADQDAKSEQRKGEQKAAQERQRGQRESGGLFGWLASRARSFFRGIIAGIKMALDAMAAAVGRLIDAARKLAREAIERARSAITAIGRRIRDGLLAIGNALGVDLQALYERFTTWIKEKIAQAKAFLTELANKLKDWVQNALNALQAALSAAWDALKGAWNAVVDAVKNAVKAAMDWAKSALEALAAFAALVKDVASDPIGWIGKLGAAVVDGIRNHLWGAFKAAVKEWFNSKLEQVLGLGKMVWDLIAGGGLALADIGRMAWEGIKALIPPTLIRILVEKLVAMIVPAAGAVMVVIEGLQAAWGTVSRIIAAFQAFFAFLKAVKGGGAGPQFATAVAAAAVAVIDFVANWLIAKLARGAAKIGGKIKGLAKKILGRKKGRAAGRRSEARDGARGGARDGARGRRPSTSRRPPRRAPTRAPAGRRPRRSSQDRRNDRRRERERRKRERLDRAVKALEPKVNRLLKKGVSKRYLKVRLLLWRARYRLSSLAIINGAITAAVNPKKKLAPVSDANLGALLRPIFAKAEAEYERQLMDDPATKKKIEDAQKRYESGDESALKDLSRFEQSRVIRETIAPPATGRHRRPEPKVKVWVPQAGGKGMVQHAGRYESGKTRTGRRIPSISETVAKYARQFNVSDREIASILGGHPQDIEGKLGELEGRLRSGQTTKTGRRQVGRLINRLRRVAFLTQAFEPSRSGGIATTRAVSTTMVAAGDVELKETISAEGSMAPMMQKHVAPESGKAETPEQKEAAKVRDERIGRVFNHLLKVAEKQDVLVARGGYDLKGLADAVRNYLKVVQRRYRTKDELKNSEGRLIAEVVKLLSSYHGS